MAPVYQVACPLGPMRRPLGRAAGRISALGGSGAVDLL
jgi:hypothetical protein